MASSIITSLAQNAAGLILVRAGRCIVTGMKYVNADATTAGYCQVFDAAATASVVLGTTSPVWVLAAGTNGDNDDFTTDGITFTNGIVIAFTITPTGSAGTGLDDASQNFLCTIN